MEVHAHTHTARKKWTHYFWEFLMLFLAVFCGFLAEYQLEHKIENDRERQYMESLYYDLQRDTANLRRGLELGVSQKGKLDSLVVILNTQEITGKNIEMLYMLQGNTGRVLNVFLETRTSSQLKNAGGMRLIRKKNVADSIIGYWRRIEVCDLVSNRLEQLSELRSSLGARLFHNKYYIRDDGPLAPVTGIKPGAKLITNDPVLLAEYSNRSYSRAGIINNYISALKRAQEVATRLMKLLKDNYKIE